MTHGKVTIATIAALLLGASTLSAETKDTYTLYRSSATGAEARIHVATFDADEAVRNARKEGTYNQLNCSIAADLFASLPGVEVKYWCEKGRYRP